jgi:hypothetical protein
MNADQITIILFCAAGVGFMAGLVVHSEYYRAQQKRRDRDIRERKAQLRDMKIDAAVVEVDNIRASLSNAWSRIKDVERELSVETTARQREFAALNTALGNVERAVGEKKIKKAIK